MNWREQLKWRGPPRLAPARISDNADGHAVITLGEGHRITLLGVAGDDLTPANFAFV